MATSLFTEGTSISTAPICNHPIISTGKALPSPTTALPLAPTTTSASHRCSSTPSVALPVSTSTIGETIRCSITPCAPTPQTISKTSPIVTSRQVKCCKERSTFIGGTPSTGVHQKNCLASCQSGMATLVPSSSPNTPIGPTSAPTALCCSGTKALLDLKTPLAVSVITTSPSPRACFTGIPTM